MLWFGNISLVFAIVDTKPKNQVLLTRCQVILQRFRLNKHQLHFKPNKYLCHKQDTKIFYFSQAKLQLGLCELTTQDGSHWVPEVCSWILECGDVIVIARCFDFSCFRSESRSTFSLSVSHVGKHAHLSFLPFACPSSLCLFILMSSLHILLSHIHWLHTHTSASIHPLNHSCHSQHNVCFYKVSLSHSVFTSVMPWSNNSAQSMWACQTHRTPL